MNTTAQPAPGAPLIARESGLLVPGYLAGVPEEPGAEGPSAKGGVDKDGRRRVVFSKNVRRLLTKLSEELDRTDLAIVIVCKAARTKIEVVKDAATKENVAVSMREEIPGACGKIMLREDEGGIDPGFGCDCSRIHFVKGV